MVELQELMPALAEIAKDVDRLLVEILQDVCSDRVSSGAGVKSACLLQLDRIALFQFFIVACLGIFGILGLVSITLSESGTDESSSQKDGSVSVALDLQLRL